MERPKGVIATSTTVKQIRILLADDHEMVRRGMRSVLESYAHLEVCGEALNGREAVAMAQKLKPDIAILDYEMPELNGLEATRQIKRALPQTEVLIFTGHEEENLVHEVLEAGAKSYLVKTGAKQHIIDAIEALSNHKPFFTSAVSDIVFSRYLHGPPPKDSSAPGPLTGREREVLQLLAEGKSNKDVSTQLGISVKTCETHRASIMRKLKLENFSDLVRYAIRNHIIQA